MLASTSRRLPVTLRAFATDVGKQVVTGQKARLQILRGADILADTVGATLGPRGRNVVIEQTYGGCKITKDGVTVAKAIELAHPLENLGASLIKQVAQAANDASGDGTTTATVLAREIYKRGCEAVAAGLNPMEMIKGIKLATETVREFLKDFSKPVVKTEEIYNVATVSANGDQLIGKLIAQAMDKVGRDGTITVTEGKTLQHSLTFVEGYSFDRGYISPYFCTNTKTQKCELENPYVLLSQDKITTLASLVPILEQVIQANAELLIIAEDLEPEALATLVVNKLRGGLKVCAVRAPGFGDYRKKQLEDLGVLCGGCVVCKDVGTKVENLQLSDLGRFKRAIIGKDETLLLEGNSSRRKIEERLKSIKYQIDHTDDLSEYEKTKLQERYGKLSGHVAVLNVGGASEVEVSEAKDRLDDALNATRAAVESGILPGGGSALLFAASKLEGVKGDNLDQETGVKILKKACALPLKLIASNAGYEGPVIAANLLRDNKYGDGFDANTGRYVNMFEAGIVDPTKVVMTALSDASSVAAMMCTTEAAIYKGREDGSKVERGMPGEDDY